MRIAPFLASAAATIALVIVLDRPIGKIPPLGKFLSPQYGFWQNAEPLNMDYGGFYQTKTIKRGGNRLL